MLSLFSFLPVTASQANSYLRALLKYMAVYLENNCGQYIRSIEKISPTAAHGYLEVLLILVTMKTTS